MQDNLVPDEELCEWFKDYRTTEVGNNSRFQYWNLGIHRQEQMLSHLARQFKTKTPKLKLKKKNGSKGRQLVYLSADKSTIVVKKASVFGRDLVTAFYNYYWWNVYHIDPRAKEPEDDNDYLDPAETFSECFWKALTD